MQKYKSPHGWFIISLVIFTLSIFLLMMVYSTDDTLVGNNVTTLRVKTDNPHHSSTKNPDTHTPMITAKIVRSGKVLYPKDKMDLIKEAVRRYLHSLPDSIQLGDQPMQKDVYSNKNIKLKLHGYEISKLSIGKSFYLYSCTIVPTNEHLVVSLLIELPDIQIVFKDHPEYSQYCPTINPYIHTVELIYHWGYDKDTLETFNHMKLSNLKIQMVSWGDNLYNKSYQQVKNSPLFKVNVPVPLDLKKEDVYDFITQSTIFSEIPMIFQPPVFLQSLENKQSIEVTMTVS